MQNSAAPLDHQEEQQAHTSPGGRLQLPNLSSIAPALNHAAPLASPRREAPKHAGSSPSVSHRPSFADNLRGMPGSPRQRNPSFSQQALQDLINNPPVAKHDANGDKFQDRDWKSIHVGEIIAPEEVRFVEVDTSVEAATKVRMTESASTICPQTYSSIALDRVRCAQRCSHPRRQITPPSCWRL